MIHEFIRLTAVSFSSDNCQTKEQQMPDFISVPSFYQRIGVIPIFFARSSMKA